MQGLGASVFLRAARFPQGLLHVRTGKVLRGTGPLAALLRGTALAPVYQPIASLKSGSVFAHEALIRGPQGGQLQAPTAMLKAASQEGLNAEFETACAFTQLRTWGRKQQPGRIFVNISADVLVRVVRVWGQDGLLAMLSSLGVAPRMVVLEITEHHRVSDMDRLARVVDAVRGTGLSLALDDFGDGRSSLRLWSQLHPEYVKIDKYFTKDISHHADKLKTIQALQQIATIFQTALVAEGIETPEDLRVLRDMGIPYGQGYLLGHPDAEPRTAILPQASELLNDNRLAVFPELSRIVQRNSIRLMPVVEAPQATPFTSNDELAQIFLAHPDLHALAVVDAGRPVAIINRVKFINEYSRLYYREVWGRKPCMVHANLSPRLIERDHRIDELIGILTSDDQRYLADGFIVTENGRYVGLGTSDHLVRSVTESRIESARHANPLTLLPGNVPITQHIERLLTNQVAFVACYADLNHFKPFNDLYGYWRGDEMIRLLARIVSAHCDPLHDFVGHVGGDDFIVLFQSSDWHACCLRIIAELAEHGRALFDEQARERGGIEAEDRHGVLRFFPCTTLAIGAVVVQPGQFMSAEQVASEAALAKHEAKSSADGLYLR